jgi:gamma-glutamylcyclotransferase (GGCT)/AIG2-like uncharacterized protein YtfP
MTGHLFVYGTLLPSAAHEMGRTERARLALQERWVGPATVRGQLYDLGEYPGLAFGTGVVYGGIYQLLDPAGSLVWLDAYEGVTGHIAADQYSRVIWDARMHSGEIVSTWLYIICRLPAGAAAIPSGRWQSR